MSFFGELWNGVWSFLVWAAPVLAPLLKVVFVLVLLLTFAPVLTWAERRQSAMMQDRVGPYRAGIPMPQVVLDLVPAAAMGAFGVAVLCGASSLFFMLGALITGDGADFLRESSGISAWWLVVISGGVAALHVGMGRILPDLFFEKRLTAFGLIHPLADAMKMIWKEDFVPPKADKLLFAVAPIIAVIPAFATFAVIPFGPTLYIDHLFDVIGQGGADGTAVTLQVANLNVGILYMFAIAGMGIVGAAIAGYSSDNKYALLGGIRAAGQMVSYEVTLGLSLVGCFMVYDSLLLGDAVTWQQHHVWGIVVQPLAYVLFQTASIAEYKRVPFDAPEGESEIVAGYFLEYSGMKWGMWMMGEFIEVVVSSAVIATLFFGGFDTPFVFEDGLHFWLVEDLLALVGISSNLHVDLPHVVVVLLQIGGFVVKMALLCFLSLQVRWTLPRFRYDQIMNLCWKVILPLSLLNVLLTGIGILAFGGE